MDDKRAVTGFPGYYVTKDGRVLSTNNSRDGSPKELAARRQKNGWCMVVLCRGADVRKHAKVSDLVMAAFGTLEHYAKEDAAHAREKQAAAK